MTTTIKSPTPSTPHTQWGSFELITGCIQKVAITPFPFALLHAVECLLNVKTGFSMRRVQSLICAQARGLHVP